MGHGDPLRYICPLSLKSQLSTEYILQNTDKKCSIPYAPFSKTDKLGKFADWTEGDTRDGRAGAPGPQQRYGNRRDGQPAYGSGSTNAFAYIHEQDEASFSLVDNKPTVPRRGGMGGYGRGRGGARGAAMRGGALGRGGARGGATTGRGGARPPMRRGWKDWDKVRLRLCPIIAPPNFWCH